ncbi:MAG: transposase [Anaerolineae bacterium]
MDQHIVQSTQTYYTPRAGLCALGALLTRRGFFDPLARQVHIPQKVRQHTPLDKLTDAFIGILSGVSGLYLVDKTVRPDVALQRAFGRQSCAEQATIHDTLYAAEAENVLQLRAAWRDLFRQYSRASQHDYQQTPLVIDLDLSGERTGRRAAQASTGYFVGQRGAYGRQHGRALAAAYDEVIVERLYVGNIHLAAVMRHLLEDVENVLPLTPHQHSRVIVRMDAAGGRVDDIAWLLARGYHVHLKLYSWHHAAALAQSVRVWRTSPLHPKRQVGLVHRPYAFGYPTTQIAVRTVKTSGHVSYHVIVSSVPPEDVVALVGRSPQAAWDADALILAYADLYDDRSGPIEHSFGEGHQALPLTKRHRRAWVAQEIALLLVGLAHNTLVWLREWLAEGWAACRDLGLLRLVRDVLTVPGYVTLDATGRLLAIHFNALDPCASSFVQAWQPLLRPHAIDVGLAPLSIVINQWC